MHFLRTYLLLLTTCAAICSAQPLRAQTPSDSPLSTTPPAATSSAPDSTTTNAIKLSAQLGFAGQWKLGHIAPVRVDIEGLDRPPENISVELQTLDGDGVLVSYKRSANASQLTQNNSGTRSLWVPIRIGRLQAAVTIRLLNSEKPTGQNQAVENQAAEAPDAEKLLAEKRYEADELPTALPSTQPLIVTFGATNGVEASSATNVAGTATTFTTATIQSAADIPDASICFSAVDLLIIPTNSVDLIRDIRPEQWQATDRWLRDGGSGLITLGPEARDLSSIKPFAALLPGEVLDYSKVTNPGPLESYVGTNDPIEVFEVTRFNPSTATIDLTLLDSLNRRIPWLSRHAYGLGSIQVVASDLDQPAFTDWPDRNKLWRILLGRTIDLGIAEKSLNTQIGTASYLGYDDLVGQLRASLDVFPSLTVVSFGQAVTIIVALLLVIGPLDYFLSVKWLKRPDFSWYFAGSMLIIASLGLMALRNNLRPDEVRINTVQVVDIDTTSNQATGHLWSHVYSSQARQLDLRLQTSAPENEVAIDWQGLPGRGLGGLMSQLNTDLGMPSYLVQQDTAVLTQVGIPNSGTKCISATWHHPIELSAQAKLKEIAGIDQLEGDIVNPLPVDLKDCMLIYHHWYYSMPSRIAPGQSIRVSFETIPKDLPRRLNGRRVVQGSEQITPWNPADRNSIPRLLEMLMFYKAASGPTYTTLMHRYQPQLDFSNLLMLNRAILVGRIEEPLASIQVGGDPSTPSAVQDMNQTWVRLVFPVEASPSK